MNSIVRERLYNLFFLSTLAVAACSSSSDPDDAGPRDGSSLPDFGVVDPLEDLEYIVLAEDDDLSKYSACYADVQSQAKLIEADQMLRPVTDGTLDVAISDLGCHRFVREIEGGVLKRASFYAFLGVVTARLIDGEYKIVAYLRRYAIWEREPDGTLRGKMDTRGEILDYEDTVLELETEERLGYYRVTEHDPSGTIISHRLTVEEVGGQTVQTVEHNIDGTLTVVERTVLDDESFVQSAGYDIGECLGQRTSCTPEQQAALDSSFQESILRGTACMNGLDQNEPSTRDDWQRLEALKNMWTQRGQFACMPAGCSFAHWDDGMKGSGQYQIDVGVSDWMGLSRSVQLGTLFHEFMHGVLGGHSDAIVNSEINLPNDRQGRLMRRYVDRVDACEAYCFGDMPTQCSCATCLNVKTCDEPCGSLTGCVERDCTGPAGCVDIMSEAVGTACIIVTDPLTDEESANWYTTLASCEMSDCGSRGGSCRSYSRSCDENCK